VLLFARVPVPGRVKTRLAARIGEAEAAAAHRACTLDAIGLAQSVRGCRRRLLLAGEESRLRNAGIVLPAGWELERQRGRDLGARLERAFAEAFRRGAEKVAAIGTDTPWMGRGRIETALEWLDGDDVVLGPSADGGYYLVGARRFLPALFRGIGWGSRMVLGGTRRALERDGVSYRLLCRDFDLDRPTDLERARELVSREPARAPELAAWFRRGEGAERWASAR
jgi:rSAM/selenodomain-associated transferase 1